MVPTDVEDAKKGLDALEVMAQVNLPERILARTFIVT